MRLLLAMLISVDGCARRIGHFKDDAAAAASFNVSILRTRNSSTSAVMVADRPYLALLDYRLTDHPSKFLITYFGCNALDFKF